MKPRARIIAHVDDKPAVREVRRRLMAQGPPWPDQWELRPGMPWQRTLEEQNPSSESPGP